MLRRAAANVPFPVQNRRTTLLRSYQVSKYPMIRRQDGEEPTATAIHQEETKNNEAIAKNVALESDTQGIGGTRNQEEEQEEQMESVSINKEVELVYNDKASPADFFANNIFYDSRLTDSHREDEKKKLIKLAEGYKTVGKFFRSFGSINEFFGAIAGQDIYVKMLL